ncbi:twin-arginine translocase TatA/TatE family subunit [Mucilaginibacter mali]|uniref:Twin-arginine translocase TatA/TatE family subunit n=1 Tax=Mucilaginibacter mali TaxID=2740462 RepID=A0A7D4UC28_9SPHI|nr:twin-arginine translocase TatA/TatE family subunit [Mucilaginibacter mali]QKJ28899.1 twin-arginine translocase TatA/TatE family subunit [Mucilaginibacter mali]
MNGFGGQEVLLMMIAVLLFIGAKRIPELMIRHEEKKKSMNNTGYR